MSITARRPQRHRSRPTRRASWALVAIMVVAAPCAITACSSQAETGDLDAPSAYAGAIAALQRAGQGSFSVATSAEGQETATSETTWQLSPARHRTTTVAIDPNATTTEASSTVIEDAEYRWTLAPEHHEADDCWVRTPATGSSPGVPGALRLLLDGTPTSWEHAGAVLLADGPASAVLDAVGPLGTSGDLSSLVTGLPDTATVEFSVLVTDGTVTALRADLGAALRAAEDAGVTLPEALTPLASTAVTIDVMVGFHDLAEDVDTAPPAEEKVRTCS